LSAFVEIADPGDGRSANQLPMPIVEAIRLLEAYRLRWPADDRLDLFRRSRRRLLKRVRPDFSALA
jgi:hypothetical protein